MRTRFISTRSRILFTVRLPTGIPGNTAPHAVASQRRAGHPGRAIVGPALSYPLNFSCLVSLSPRIVCLPRSPTSARLSDVYRSRILLPHARTAESVHPCTLSAPSHLLCSPMPCLYTRHETSLAPDACFVSEANAVPDVPQSAGIRDNHVRTIAHKICT